MVDEKGKVALNSKETIEALKYATELQKTMIPGTLTWNDVGNNQAYQSGAIGMTFNGVSLYYSMLKSPDPKVNAMAADTFTPGHAVRPVEAQADVRGADQRDAVQAQQVSERRQGIHPLHDGEGPVRACGCRTASATGASR